MWNRLKREKQMTTDASRLMHLATVSRRSAVPTASSEYCQVGRWKRTLARGLAPVASGFPRTQEGAFVGLEPYEGKLSSTVLRGGRAGNSPPLLGLSFFRLVCQTN